MPSISSLILLFLLKSTLAVDCNLTFWPHLTRSVQLPQSYSKALPNVSNAAQQPTLLAGQVMRFNINCSCCKDRSWIKKEFPEKGMLFYRIFAENRYSTILSRQPNVDPVIRSRFESAGDMSTKYRECKDFPLCAILYTPIVDGKQAVNYPFWVEANLIGRSGIKVELVWVNATLPERPDDIPLPSALSEKDIKKRKKNSSRNTKFTFELIAEAYVRGGNDSVSHVTVFLKPQIFYTIFDWSVFFVAGTIALSAGCNIDPSAFVRQIKRKPLAVAVGLFMQLFISPLIGLLAGYASSLSKEKIYGLFVTTTLQVGTCALIIISLSDCHEQFALAIAHLSNILNLATAPLWIYTVGTYVLKQEIYLLRFCGLITLISLVQMLGFLLRYARPSIAHGVLTWFSRPFLLLAGILFVTLGVYINQYVFQAPQQIAYLQHVGVALLIMLTMSYACAWLAGLLLNISVRRTRALANQVSVYQGLLAIPLLRICVPSPEGEQVSAAALWTVFLTPVPLIYNEVLKFLIRTGKSMYKAHKMRMRKRGPTAMLCADSLAAVAFTSMLLPDNVEIKHKSTNTSDALPFDEASNSTVNSAPVASRKYKRTFVRPNSSALLFSFKESSCDAENREKIIEALARKGGASLSEKRGRKNGRMGPHPRSMDDGFGGGVTPSWGPETVPYPPPSSKPIF
ncbi:unnamed protein product [Rodentolepis nana]|uniref:Intimal thickness related receptor IRP domain-containing protein n=1 Tax=Rodentolepis nana TaxID=102285 RepID=A0A0R3TM24_RODNA|nr:unnamed protein product [Rodentolepis nana]